MPVNVKDFVSTWLAEQDEEVDAVFYLCCPRSAANLEGVRALLDVLIYAHTVFSDVSDWIALCRIDRPVAAAHYRANTVQVKHVFG